MGGILVVIGLVIVVVGGIMLLIEAFKESVMWGVGSLLFSPVSLVFVFMHWDVAKKPFLLQLGGIALFVVGGIAGGGA